MMTSLNAYLENLPNEQRDVFFIHLAVVALEQYPIAKFAPVFLQHNSGITYRIDSVDRNSHFLLKIHEPVGTGPKASFEQIQTRMKWLERLTETSSLVVQSPIKNTSGAFVTSVAVSEVGETVLCTLQRWIDGEHQDGDFTIAQAEAVGVMMATLHQTSNHWQSSTAVDLPDYQISHLFADIKQLSTMLDINIISFTQFAAIEQAAQRISEIVSTLGTSAEVYGPIHGDLHQGNILFFQEQVRPIDFDSLMNSYYLFDLGTTLYHILYQSTEIRNALIDSYASIYKLPIVEYQYLEVFVAWSAINNLAFQSTIPQQIKSKFFVRNIYQLTDIFCAKVIKNEAFVST